MMRYILVFLVLGILASCKKYLDINENPNASTSPPINGLLASVTLNTGLNVYNVGYTTSYYVQYLASPNASSATDVYEPVDLSGTWTALYNTMTDIYDMEQMAAEEGASQYEGVAKILMAMNLQLVHNLWGAAPYSSAFTSETLTPSYDDAQTIFQTTMTLIDEGITLLQDTTSTRSIPTSGGTQVDLIHNGSSEAWIRTAHALKARLLNQLSKTAQYDPAAIFNELAAAYTSEDQSAAVRTFDERNPWNEVAVDNADLILDGWLSEQFIDAMDGTTYGVADPRLPLMATETQFGDYRGTPNGAGRVGTGVDEEESYLPLEGFYSSEGSPLYIITYEELKFIEAEAALRSGDKPRAYAAYLEGIRANMIKMNVPADARISYVDNPAIAVGADNLTLEDIFTEKYKALFLSPVSWDDARRFDYAYKDFDLPQNAVTSEFIRRLVYPSVETSRNGANVPSVTDVTEPLWWDQ